MKKIKVLLCSLCCLCCLTYTTDSAFSAALSEYEYQQSYYAYTMSEYMKNGEWMNLLNTSLETTRIYPEYPTAYFYLGIALDELGKHEEAIKAYNNVLSLTGNQKDEFLYQARALANRKAGNYKAAMRDYNTSISASPTLRALYQRELTRFDIWKEGNNKAKSKSVPANTDNTKKDCNQVL